MLLGSILKSAKQARLLPVENCDMKRTRFGCLKKQLTKLFIFSRCYMMKSRSIREKEYSGKSKCHELDGRIMRELDEIESGLCLSLEDFE